MKFYSLSFTLLCLTITQLHASSDEHKEQTIPTNQDYSMNAGSYQTNIQNNSTKPKILRRPVSTPLKFISADQLLERSRSLQLQKNLDQGPLQERTAQLLAQSSQIEEYMLAKYPHLKKPQTAQVHPAPLPSEH